MRETQSNRGVDRPWLSWIILLILIGVAFALRWRYIHEISLSVDEFNTIWAARHVLVRGIPSFPSGNIYPHGFVFTYLVVPFVLGDFSEPLARLPGLIVSLAAIPVAYWVGRKLFDDRVGLIVAAVMAVDPDGILWGGRARMYGLLQLLTLLVVYLYYRGIAKDRARDRYLAMALVVVAIFTHAEAGLLLPALGVATLVAWPWRRLVRRDVILPFVVAGIGAAIFFLISKYGQQEHLDIIRESRP
ncbi:MAG TPA: glycosyltransferase family 39 protein, partial [Anaerolineae bacterium]|nr:glycosyltransferase family 39 protein [Anaerolineae bacterium]